MPITLNPSDALNFKPEAVCQAPTSPSIHNYWFIANDTELGVGMRLTSLFVNFRNHPAGERKLYPVWHGIGEGSGALNPALIPDDMIGESLGEVRAMGFPEAYPVLAYSLNEHD